MASSALPAQSIPTFVEVGALPTGWLTLPRKWLFAGEEKSEESDTTPVYSFVIHHPKSGRRVMFDLGLNKDLSKYSPAIQEEYLIVFPKIPKDAAELLTAGGVNPNQIDTVVYSHMHWDHIGEPLSFPAAEIIIGPGAKKASSPGWPIKNGGYHEWALQPPSGKLRELSYTEDEWKSVGAFPKAIDFFGDGSFYIVDTPGHMPGHLSGLARTGEDEWVFMGGDVCHSRHLFSPCCRFDIGTTYGPGPGTSMHMNPPVARVSISQVRQMQERKEVFVAIAHDQALEGIMPEFPLLVNGWRKRGDKEECDKKGKLLPPIRD